MLRTPKNATKRIKQPKKRLNNAKRTKNQEKSSIIWKVNEKTKRKFEQTLKKLRNA